MLERLVRFLSRASAASVPATAPASTPRAPAEELKQRGNDHLADGKLDAAADCYRQAIAIDPDYAEAYNNLAYVCLKQGLDDEAERHLDRAISLNPGLANAHYNLGTLFQKDGRTEQALACYEMALTLAPDSAETLYRLGELSFRLRRNDKALTSLRRAIKLNPDALLAHYSLALLLRQIGEAHEAMACLNRAIVLAPDFAEAFYELGNLLRAQKQLEPAVLNYEKAVALRPAHHQTRHDLGLALLMQEKQSEAAASFREAIRIEPDFAAAHMSLAEALHRQGKLDEAMNSVDRAIALAPDVAEAHTVLGLVFKDQGMYKDAEKCLRHALTLKPDSAPTRYALSTALLASGRFAEGWDLFGRLHYGEGARDFGRPRWQGEDLRGKAIIVWGDQGIGDEILFASLFPELVARARHCVIECAHKLVPLFARSFPDATVVPRMTPPYSATREGLDLQVAAADAARWLRGDLESFPSGGGYLIPDPERVAYWRARLAALGPGLKVGFAWRSNLHFGQRDMHYTSLDLWGAIFAAPGVHFINLQYGQCADELAAARQRFGVPLHAFDEVDLFDDLAEAAALNQALDLVISAPTVTAFLSGALGVPTWMMSYATPWQTLGTDHVPWFPAMRCFPRRWHQTWSEVLADIARQLRHEAV